MSTAKPIAGREKEIHLLEESLHSKKAELIALYGRRRVGKTYLIREFFKNKSVVFFNTTGTKNAKLSVQLAHFTQEIARVFYNNLPLAPAKNWDAAFHLLTRAIEEGADNKTIVLFFDELPWMATPKSHLLEMLDYYWNQYWSRYSNIKCFICGSSASWIIDKIVNNPGGLHNRLTRPALLIQPMNLFSTKQLLASQGINLSHKQILQLYMVTGGVPYYLSMAKNGQSASQIINELAFGQHGLLQNEFNILFASLFKNHELCEQMIKLIAESPYGISQQALFNKLGKNTQGKLGLTKLKELEDAGFIIKLTPFQNKKKGVYYKVIDEYTLFYLKWIEPIKSTLIKNTLPLAYWEKQSQSPAWHSWSGIAFESICYKHLPQIALTLKLFGFYVPSSWRFTPKPSSKQAGAQIDLLFDRDDDAITLCEIKYTDHPYQLDKAEAKKILNRMQVFQEITKTTKQLFFSIISANGMTNSLYTDDLITGLVTLDDLFHQT